LLITTPVGGVIGYVLTAVLEHIEHPEHSGWRPAIFIQCMLLSIVLISIYSISEAYMDIDSVSTK
jgi:hypothetical protein